MCIGLLCSQRLDELSTPIDTLDLKGRLLLANMPYCSTIFDISRALWRCWRSNLLYPAYPAGVRLDGRSCELLEVVLSRMQMTTLDLEKANLEDEVDVYWPGALKTLVCIVKE